MKRLVGWFMTGSLLAAGGCGLHSPYGPFNDNTTLVPPLGKLTHRNNLPPAQMLMHPGPGVDGPGPGVLLGEPAMPVMQQESQIAFVSPDGMSVAWDVGGPGLFDSEPMITPAKQNFPQGAIYRLKLSNIPGRPGIELYPTLEVAPPTPRTEAYLAHSAIPAAFSEEDFDQVQAGNFVTKVIYLPDPEFQELALSGIGVDTLVSTKLDPGVDPIVEADRRGTIMAIVRLGNKDLQSPSTGGEAIEGDVIQAAYLARTGHHRAGAGYAAGCPDGYSGGGLPPGFVAGVTAPQYGMPSSGTPIGLPGPPHVPLGVPAGLQRHVVVNHTKMHIPPPVKDFRIDVKQEPGFSYPEPPHHMAILERTFTPPVWFRQPFLDKHEHVLDDQASPGYATDCPQ